MSYKYITKCNIQKYVHFFAFTLITFLVSMLARGFEGDGSAIPLTRTQLKVSVCRNHPNHRLIGLSYLAADMKEYIEGWGRNGATHRERHYYNWIITSYFHSSFFPFSNTSGHSLTLT